MKFLFINSVCDYGSTGRIIRDLSVGLKDKGHDVLLAYGRYPSDNTEDTFYFGNDLETKVHGFMTRMFGRHGLHSTKATKKLIAKIKEYKPDVIHIHNLHGYVLNVPLLLDYLATLDIPIYLTLHDAWVFSGSSAYFDYAGCKVWEDGCVECNSTEDYPKVVGIKRQRKNFAWKKDKFTKLKNLTVITPSHWLKEMSEKTFLKKYPIEVVHNGIDTKVFKPTENKDLEEKYKGKKVLLQIISAWEKRKGVEDFIELSKRMDSSYKFVLVGLKPEELALLPDTVEGITRTKDVHELAAYYSIAHAFLNPTYEDNYPTVNLESICCNTPVIAYDTGGNKEVASAPYMNIVKQGDIDAIESAVYKLPEKTDLIDTLKYDKSYFIEEMFKVYFK